MQELKMNETPSNSNDNDWSSALDRLKEAKKQTEQIVRRLKGADADRLNMGNKEHCDVVFELCKAIFESLGWAERLATASKEKLGAKWPGELRYRAEFLLDQAGKGTRSASGAEEILDLAATLDARIGEAINDPTK